MKFSKQNCAECNQMAEMVAGFLKRGAVIVGAPPEQKVEIVKTPESCYVVRMKGWWKPVCQLTLNIPIAEGKEQ